MTSRYRQIIDLRRPEAPATRTRPLPGGAGADADATPTSARRAEQRPAPEPPRDREDSPKRDETPKSDVDFSELGLIDTLQRAVATAGYSEPTPIQARAIPTILEGRDLLGVAQTGTGKTAAFALPLLQRLDASPSRRRRKRARVLVLTPTRELAIQVGESFNDHGLGLRIRCTVVFGGVNQGPQVRTMASGVDVLVATPGRLLDLMGQGQIELDGVEAFVLDEADRMLDMGFIRDVEKIIARLPSARQTLLFSATMPTAVARLARKMMRDSVHVEVTPAATTVDRVSQSVMFVDKARKKDLLADVFADRGVTRAIVFSRTKRGAGQVARFLEEIGVPSAPIHGNKSQSARQRALAAFQNGDVRALVATDIAARGIDVDQVTHVINFDLPNEPESYVHRIGRTARAGNDGVALSFCMRDELDYLRAIERVIRQPLTVRTDQPFHSEQVAADFRSGKRGSIARGGSRPQGARRPRGGRPRRRS